MKHEQIIGLPVTSNSLVNTTLANTLLSFCLRPVISSHYNLLQSAKKKLKDINKNMNLNKNVEKCLSNSNILF